MDEQFSFPGIPVLKTTPKQKEHEGSISLRVSGFYQLSRKGVLRSEVLGLALSALGF